MIKDKLKDILFFRFLNKKEKPNKAEDMIQAVIKHLPAIREMLRNNSSNSNNVQIDTHGTGTPIESEGQQMARLYDFFKNYDYSHSFESGAISSGSDWNNPAPAAPDQEQKEQKKDEKIAATPLSVLAELQTIPTPITVIDLDQKIETLKDKTLLSNQIFVKQQLDALIIRLENRKKYKDHVEFFSSFQNTTDAAIDTLLKKYKLVIKESELFIPTFPKEAINVMKKYTEVTSLVCEKAPVFYVIAEETDFKDKFKKLDPILLVQSPFGFFWQILGAWDKEMLLLSEL